MAFTWEDAEYLLSEGDDGRGRETFSTELADVQTMSLEELKKTFPDTELSHSQSVVYLPVRMCNSLPAINKRRRCFTPQTLANSFASAKDSLVDLDHMLVDNGLSNRDIVIGHIAAARFDPEGKTQKEIASQKYVPEEPAPLMALAALYNRLGSVSNLIEEHKSGKKRWSVSMECGHLWKESFLMYRDEFIPFREADGGMLEGISAHTIRSYKGHEVAAVIGGLNGWVDFWGMGMTLNPADSRGDVLAIFGGRPRELASRKIFHMPLRMKNFSSLEAANTGVDSNIKEMASVTVIGTTDSSAGPLGEDHAHEVLSDGTILPAQNHTHYLASFGLVVGTKPKLTGRTDMYHRYSEGGLDRPHMHMIDIPLNKKFKADSEAANFTLEFNDMDAKEFLKKLEDMLSSGKSLDKDGQTNMLREIASMKEAMNEASQKDAIRAAVEAEIASLIQKGELVKKDDVAKAVTAKEAEVKATYEREKADASKRGERLKKVSDLGIDLNYVIDESENLTVQKMVDEIATDADGDKAFNRQFKTLEHMAATAKSVAASGDPDLSDPTDDDEQEPDTTDRGRTGKKAKAVANAGKAAPAKKVALLVGNPTGATAEEREVANNTKPKVGRHIFSKKS